MTGSQSRPPAGWPAQFGAQTTAGGTLKGVVIVVRDLSSAPWWAKPLQDALLASGIGGQGIINPDQAAGTSTILIAPKL